MRRSDRMGFAVMIAMACAVLSLREITTDSQVFVWSGLAIIVVGNVGVICRRLRFTEGWVHLAQIAAGLATCLVLLGGISRANPVVAFNAVIDDAVRWVRASSSPMGPNASVALLAAVGVVLLTLTADMLVVSLGRPGLILIPLLTCYAIPALVNSASVSLLTFLLFCTGLGVVFIADAASRTAAATHTRSRPGYVATVGAITVLVAALGSVLLSALAPIRDSGSFGPFQGRGPIQMADPSLDLKRNLEQPSDRVVIRYRTNLETGAYLRMAALTRMDSAGWHLEQLELFGGGLPPAPGINTPGPERRSTVSIEGFDSQWLPLPYAPNSFDAAGEWRHDPLSMVVLWAGASDRPGTRDLSYDVVSHDVVPAAATVARARAGRPPDAEVNLRTPADLPEDVRTLAREVTKGANTDGGRALALQEWFRSDTFSYSTEPAGGSGYTALVDFLTDDRRGYCEQFAASMAIMARTVGIPARVVVGFLPGKRVGDEFEVSIRDMHTWPELYFEGLGWVAFEPTPSVSGGPPPYATPTTSATPTPTPTPTPSTSEEPDASETPTPSAEPTPATSGPGIAWGTVGGWAGLLALIAAGGYLPRWIRTRRRTIRLAVSDPSGRAEAAWDELRDVVWDNGDEWPTGSPRRIAEQVADGLTPPAHEALDRLAVWVERARFDQTPGDVPDLSTEVTLVASEIANRPRRRQVIGRWLPRSVWRGLWPR